ncbi:MAG: apolipoprotein N-acyltransferase [Candidatus Nanopelagicales bacterium]
MKGLTIFGRSLVSVVGGTLLALAFPPFGWFFLAPLGIAVLTAAWWRAPIGQVLLAGYFGGLAFNGILLLWIRVLGWDAWIILVAVWSLWWLLLAAGSAAATWWQWWPVGIAGMWVLAEALRGRVPFGGFPWGRVAFSQPDTTFTPWASIAGSAGVTALVALVGALLLLVARLVTERRWLQVGGTAVLAALITVSGAAITLPAAGQATAPMVQVAVIQGSVPRAGLDAMAQQRAVLNNHVTQTLTLAAQVAAGQAPQPSAVIWPENSSDVDPYIDIEARAAIDAAAAAIKAPILVGAVIAAGNDPTRLWNVGIVWEPGAGPTDMYIKRHPVPFGEYVPARSILTAVISRFDRVPKDFVGGDEAGVLQVGPARVGDVICFEIAYDAVVRDVTIGGAQMLVVQTNNATYAGTGQPEQQLAISRLRAVEHGRSVIVAATSGITAAVAPDGMMLGELPELLPGSLSVVVPQREQLTIADQVGWLPEIVLAMVGLLWWAMGVVTKRAGTNV